MVVTKEVGKQGWEERVEGANLISGKRMLMRVRGGIEQMRT